MLPFHKSAPFLLLAIHRLVDGSVIVAGMLVVFVASNIPLKYNLRFVDGVHVPTMYLHVFEVYVLTDCTPTAFTFIDHVPEEVPAKI